MYEGIGEYAATELTLNGHEQATLAILENLYKAPRNRDALFNNLGIEKAVFDRCVTLGTSSGIVAQHTARGKNILISPYYFADNLDGLADLVAGAGTPALESTLKKVKSNQGWPLSLIATTGEIGGVKLSTTEAQLVEKLAAEGIVKPPTIKFGGKTESFLFTPKPGATRLNAANREIYERAMALISAVRKGQLLPDAYRIRSPIRILESLRDNGYLRSNSEAWDQYHNLVVLRVAHLKQTSPSMWQLHLNRTEENEAALKLSIELLRSGTMANMEVDQEARIALSKGEEYIQSLISSAELKKRQKQVTDAKQLMNLSNSFLSWIESTMGKYDKDRHQKEMAIRYCLARGVSPCLEVLVPSASDLSDTVETLTDIDVLGLEFIADGGFRRTIFDCKTTNKMSPINRAFWAAGVATYTGCDDAVVILKNRAVYNHRISALQISVDLHDDLSFEDMGRTFDQEFGKDNFYQSSIDRWNMIYDIYQSNSWSEGLYNLGRHLAPVTHQPWRVFRRTVADIRNVRGQFDPVKDAHVALFLDVLSSVFMLWSSLGRDIRRFYDPKMTKNEFERALRYYIWGGKESYQIRQDIRQRAEAASNIQEFPAWERLVSLAGLIITAPQEVFGCVGVCRDLAIRLVSGRNKDHDKRLSESFTSNRRARQFVMAVVDYMIAASGIPKDFSARIQNELSSF